MNFIEEFSVYNNAVLPGVHLPQIKIDNKYYAQLNIDITSDNFTFLKTLCAKNLENKKLNTREYVERLEMELNVFNELGFVDYVLLNWDILNFCHENGIPTGPGRGSAAGSLVLFLIGVTKVDPIKYGLFFERFVSKSRAKKIIKDDVVYLDGSLLPDVDNDISYDRRSEVIKYIEAKHPGKTSKILTLNTLSSKLCIKECGKIVSGLSETEVNEISDSIPKAFGKVFELGKAYQENEKFKKWADENQSIFKIAQKIEGLNKNTGVHPSGIAISFYKIDEICPVQKTSDGEYVSGYDMNYVAELMVKFDVLGLRTLTVVNEVCKHLNIEMSSIDPEDPFIYEVLQRLKTPQGLFQIEADTNFKVCKKVAPKNLLELSDVIAIARPGALSYLDEYNNFTSQKLDDLDKMSPTLKDILKVTKGVPLYQEQAMAIGNKVFHFSLDEAEQIRRCVTGDTMFVSKQRGWISINELLETGYSNDEFLVMDENGKQTWDKIKDIWSNGIKQVRHVESKNGMTVKASRWHQFYTDNGWKARNYLSTNDYLVCANETDFIGYNAFSEEMTILICGIVTEGYFTSYNQCSFTNYDSELIDKFSSCYLTEFKTPVSFSKNNKKVAFLSRENAEKINIFLNYGLSASKKLPKEIMRLTKDRMAKAIGFLYSCEGSFYSSSHPVIEFSSASHVLIEQIQLMLLRFGITSFINNSFNKKLKKTYYKLIISDFHNQTKFKDNFFEHLSKNKQDDFLSNITNRYAKINQNIIPSSITKKFIQQYGFVLNNTSGHFFNKNISKNKFKEFVDQTNDVQWKEFCDGKQFFSKIKDLKKQIREVEVFDFSMQNEDKPFIIANGILIHNCVGKKKVEEMKKWKPRIYENAQKHNLSNETADFYWKLLEESANYSFNLSHGASYAILAAWTTYLKFKYPKEFFLALLKLSKYEPDSHKEINKISQELAYFNIQLLPPDLAKSSLDFKIENDNIRFGLNSIKGVSEKTLQSLENFRETSTPTKFDIFTAAKQAGINIGLLSSLIQAGTLSSYTHRRSRLVLEAQSFNLLTDKEKAFAHAAGNKYDYDILTIVSECAFKNMAVNDKGKPFMTEKRKQTFKQKYDEYKKIYEQNKNHEKFANWVFENKLLGYTPSTRLKSIFQQSEITFTDCLEFQSVLKDDSVKIVGVIEDVYKGKTKKTNSTFYRFQLKDETGRISAMFLDGGKKARLTEYLEDGLKIPEIDDIVIFTGRKGDDVLWIENIGILNDKIYMKLSDVE